MIHLVLPSQNSSIFPQTYRHEKEHTCKRISISHVFKCESPIIKGFSVWQEIHAHIRLRGNIQGLFELEKIISIAKELLTNIEDLNIQCIFLKTHYPQTPRKFGTLITQMLSLFPSRRKTFSCSFSIRST